MGISLPFLVRKPEFRGRFFPTDINV